MDGNAAVSAEIIDAVEVAHAIAISLLVMRRPPRRLDVLEVRVDNTGLKVLTPLPAFA